MGFLNRLFSRADPSEALLIWGLDLAREMERVYRNQLELTPANGVPTGIGLLKARLLSTTFVHAAYQYGGKRSEPDLRNFLQACSGAAMEPFSDPRFVPRVKREEAVSFAGPFMIKALGYIHQELESGPSTSEHKTAGFEHLLNMYHHCLAESCHGAYDLIQKRKIGLLADSVLFSHFRGLGDNLRAFRR